MRRNARGNYFVTTPATQRATAIVAPVAATAIHPGVSPCFPIQAIPAPIQMPETAIPNPNHIPTTIRLLLLLRMNHQRSLRTNFQN